MLHDITFWIPKGEFVCLVGPNGAGKSTFLKTVLGLVEPTRGSVEILGKPIAEAHRAVGYVPQRKGFDRSFPARAVDLIVAAIRGKWPLRVTAAERERARAVLRRVGGEGLIDKDLAGLSGGETQRVFLARALVNDPVLLILDEPTAGVDARGRAGVRRLVGGGLRLGRARRHPGDPQHRGRGAHRRARRLSAGRPRGGLGAPSRDPRAQELRGPPRRGLGRLPRRGLSVDFLTEPLSQPFMMHALIAGTIVGGLCALVGVFVVQRGLAFIGDGLAHAAFGGIALGLLLEVAVENATLVALPFTVLIALGIGYVLRRGKLRGDVAVGVFFSVSLALGVLFLGLRPPDAPAVNIESVLFGSILAISMDDLYVVAGVGAVTLVLFGLTWSRLAYLTFDPELAALQRRQGRAARVHAAGGGRRGHRRVGGDRRHRARQLLHGHPGRHREHGRAHPHAGRPARARARRGGRGARAAAQLPPQRGQRRHHHPHARRHLRPRAPGQAALRALRGREHSRERPFPGAPGLATNARR
ncbi:MAG: metal ABC transporter permease [Sandaracinaceae bacterium]|nr:metal ABC transporter permease [Sandaracinaceae bacterium]